jgi:squalene-hopene/tetraprenyl-beta-curcumene cyclase
LWFGNQHASGDENLTYGTAKVLMACDVIKANHSVAAVKAGVEWLCGAQNPDGGWGGAAGTPSSIEETALAIEALATVAGTGEEVPDTVLIRGVQWLVEQTAHGTKFEPSPIGFYFAKLWYFEKLYPLIFAVGALGAYRRYLLAMDDLAGIHK